MKRANQPPISLFTFAFCLAVTAIGGCLRSDHTVTSSLLTPHSSLPQLDRSYGQLPLSFEANQGQTDSQVKFLSRGRGYTLFLTQTEAVFALRTAEVESVESVGSVAGKERSSDLRAEPTKRTKRTQPTKQTVLRMKLEGVNLSPIAHGLSPLPGIVNYFIGNNPQNWQTNIPTYGKVEYKEVYPGIDLAYYGNQGKLEYDLIVAPGADPSQIKLAFEGADLVEVDSNGDLVLTLSLPSPLEGEGQGEGGARSSTLRLQKPLVYQVGSNGHKTLVAGNYVLLATSAASGTGTRLSHAAAGASPLAPSAISHKPLAIGFEVASYDATKPLVIDPVLVYSTYVGGSSDEESDAIAVDAAGNAYVTGLTDSTDFPTTAGAFQETSGGGDAFVTKLNATGSALVYSTYLGGSASDRSESIAVDAGGNAYVTGDTGSADFPTTPGAFQETFAGSGDAFVTKLNATGSALVYSTYLGGSGGEIAEDLALDISGNAYVKGFLTSSDFPTTPGAFQTTYGGGDNDSFVTKLDPAGATLIYSTYLGGSALDRSGAIAVDAAGNAYATGFTESADFPTTPGAFDTTLNGAADVFVTKLNPTGSALVYSTYLGGSAGGGFEEEESDAITVDAAGNAYVTGGTDSTNFPTTPGAFQTTFGGGSRDAFVTKLNSTGSALVYSTYLGGSGAGFEEEEGAGITVDADGNAYVVGRTHSADFPITPGAFQPALGGGVDVFVTKLNPTGSALVYSTYLGGSLEDQGDSIIVDANGDAYVAGRTASPGFPTTAGAFQTTFAGGFLDVFVAKISVNTPAGTNVTASAGNGATVTFTSVGASGETNATTSDTGPTPPAGFTLGTPPIYYDITTTATFAPPVTVCITYDPAQFSDPDGLRLFHFENNAWVDVTTSHDTVNDVICGQVTSFSLFVTAEPSGGPLTSLGPANIWVGLKNSDAVGIRFDLRAEVYRNSTQLVGSGEVASVPGGSSGFNNAKQHAIALTPVEGVTFQQNDTVSIKLLVRNACTGSGKNSGSARLWFNDSAANSRFDATIGSPKTYFLRDAFALAASPGPGPKVKIDVAAGAKCSPYKTFGTWTSPIQ